MNAKTQASRSAIKKLSVVLLAIGLHAGVYLGALGQHVEDWFSDQWFRIRGRQSAPSDIALIAVDEESYRSLGIPLHEALPRKNYADLLRRLSKYDPKAVVLDIVFADASPDDADLSQALSQVPTVIGADYGPIDQNSYYLETLLLPADALQQSGAKVGIASLPLDSGVIRRFPKSKASEFSELPSIAEATTSLVLSHLPATDINFPTRQDRINYYGPPNTITTYSLAQVLDSEHPLPMETLRGRIIFVGSTSRTETGPAAKDSFLTPFGNKGLMSGVEIQATLTANLLHEDWLHRQSRAWELASLSLALGIVAIGIESVGPGAGALLLVVFISGWCLVAYRSLCAHFFFPGAVAAIITLPITYLLSTLWSYLQSQQERRAIQKAFEFYLSPAMVKRVAEDPDALKRGGERVVATALFTDIQDFTNISESMKPEDVSAMLNAYFQELMEAVFEFEGTLIKFIGDAAFVLWGAPIRIDDHAIRACKAALRIQERLKVFNQKGLFPELITRAGINTGPMIVGNMGATRRFDFTAIGDSVNLASRVEGTNKFFGTRILYTESVRSLLAGDKTELDGLHLASASVAGKQEAVGLYALFPESLNDKSRSSWEQAYKFFQTKKWEDAQRLFKELRGSEPLLTTASDFYLLWMKKNPSVRELQTWNGAVTFTQK